MLIRDGIKMRDECIELIAQAAQKYFKWSFTQYSCYLLGLHSPKLRWRL